MVIALCTSRASECAAMRGTAVYVIAPLYGLCVYPTSVYVCTGAHCGVRGAWASRQQNERRSRAPSIGHP